MAQTPEGKVKKRVKETLDALGVYHFSPFQAGMGRAGIPDIIACCNGRFIAFECKSGTNKPTALQEKEMNAIRQARGMAFVINEENMADIKELLQWMR